MTRHLRGAIGRNAKKPCAWDAEIVFVPEAAQGRFRRSQEPGKEVMTPLLFSVAEFDLLRLLRWCRYVSALDLQHVLTEQEVDNLSAIGVIKLHEGSRSMILTARGNQLLNTTLSNLPPDTPPSYRLTDMIRRIRLSKLTLAAYRAGLRIFTTAIEELKDDSGLFLPSVVRGRGTNPWGSTRIAAVLRLGDMACAAHWVCPGIGKLILADELTAFSNNTAMLREVRPALLFAGECYADVLTELTNAASTTTGRLIGYGEAYRRSSLPVHLLSCDDTGAMQLQIMSRPNYREGLARAALRTKYRPTSEVFPDADAMYDGLPFAVAVDMDLQRLDGLCAVATEKGISQIAMAALEAQAEAVLYARYRDTGKARVFALTEAALTEFLGGPPILHVPVRTQFLTEKGDVVDAPSIQAHRKAVPHRGEG